MTRTRRIVATLVATAALAAPTALSTTAAAKPADKPVKSQVKQLLKDVAGKDKQLARLAASHAVTALADDTETAFVANLTEARTTLADVKSDVQAAGSTVDTRAARRELRSFRVENFRLVANVLRQVEELTDDAAADPEAQAFLAQAEAAALAIEATSSKSDIKAARDLVQDARDELALDDTGDEVEDATDTAPTA